jgi:hypothetical protein
MQALDNIPTLVNSEKTCRTVKEWFEEDDPLRVFARSQLEQSMKIKGPVGTLRYLKKYFDFPFDRDGLTRYAESQGWYFPKGRE